MSNEDIHIIAVLREAGVHKKEIQTYLSSNNYIPEQVRAFLETYIREL